MSKQNGFLAHRRGIWEHVRDGRMTLQDVAVHLYVAEQADTRTGIWNGSAGALAGELCISPRIARRVLERLSRGDYIRRFAVPGKHVCYPILVHKFLITNGQHRGEQLDAISSINPTDLRYFVGECGEQGGEHKGEHVSSQKRSKNREERKNHAAKPAPPADSRHKPFSDFAYQAFRGKYLQAPTWGAKHYEGLRLFLAKHPHIGQAEWERRYLSFLASTDAFYRQQKGSLVYFVGNFDRFIDGAILEKGSSNGNHESFSAKQRRESDDAISAFRRNLNPLDGKMVARLPQSSSH